MPKHVSDYWLERYLCAELPPVKMAEIKQCLAEDPALQQRLAELKHSNEAILQHYSVTGQTYQIQQRAAKQSGDSPAEPAQVRTPAFPRWAFPVGSLALTAALALWIMPSWLLPQLRPNPDIEITRLKGMETGLTLYRKTPNQAELLKPYAFAQRGDLLQIGYVSLTEPYGVIVSIDGRGTVTQHFPEPNQAEPKIQTKRKAILPKAYELDDAPQFERFFLITATTPIAPADVIQAARMLAKTPHLAQTQPLPLGRHFHQYSMVIQKSEK